MSFDTFCKQNTQDERTGGTFKLMTTNFLINRSLISPNSTIIIGLSGGPDSICLLHQLVQLRTEKNLKLIAAHLNHEWRESAIIDAQHCQKICDFLQVACIIKNASDLPISYHVNGSKEELGRKLRRFLFLSLAQEYHAHAIALAHHQDDQIETFFIRLIRGTTIAGLTAMQPQKGLFIRPLLHRSKQEILDYLKQESLSYIIDPTNDSQEYLRNRIRNQLMPTITTIDQRSHQNILRTMHHLQEAENFLHDTTVKTFNELITVTTQSAYTLNLKTWKLTDAYLQKRVLQHWLVQEQAPHVLSNAFLQEIERFLLSSHGGSHQLNTGWKIVKKQHSAWIIKT